MLNIKKKEACPDCGSESRVVSGNGIICSDCGTQLGEISRETGQQFGVTAGGQAVAWGRLPLANDALVQRGKEKIKLLARKLKLDNDVVVQGSRVYKDAARMGFTSGRLSTNVGAACLYMVCRRPAYGQSKPMADVTMFEFAEVLETPVRKLMRTYLKLRKRFFGRDHDGLQHVSVPVIDPCWYVTKFSRQLKLNRQVERTVERTSNQVIELMKRDWICVGRRPNGICGAALLFAARYHGVLDVDAAKIAKIVHMSETTIKQRLAELRGTSAATWSKEQLDNWTPNAKDRDVVEDYVEARNPPCVTNRKTRDVIDRGSMAAQIASEERKLRHEAAPLQDQVPAGSDRKQPLGSGCSGSGSQESVALPSLATLPLQDILTPNQSRLFNNGDTVEQVEENLNKIVTKFGGAAGSEPMLPSAARDALDVHVGKGEMQVVDEEEEEEDDPLSDISDGELEMYLCDEEEQARNSDIWHKHHSKEYLKDLERRDLEKRERDDDASISSGSRSVKRKTGHQPAASAADAIEKFLTKKGKKANQDVIASFSDLQANPANCLGLADMFGDDPL